MNTFVISKYLQFLRRKHGFTQENLARELHLSRQAVSKWETGAALPDLDTLLKLSRFYGLTINEILEPRIQGAKVLEFEDIVKMARHRLKEILEEFETEDVVKASMGASPAVYELLQSICAEVDFQKERERIGQVRMEEVESIQKQMVAAVQLSGTEFES
ncbi:helix-turn-helix domain-containing protein [Schaedlerella sp.]|uniref:helix-turn-helix domain-containing protein n=1 Tax=Schaedlerella sp. TaxID=2676057 RepID=UPI003745F701